MGTLTRLGVIGVSALLPVGAGGFAADALSYRAAVRQAANACARPVVAAKLAQRFDGPAFHGYRRPHVFLATRLTPASATAVNALHRAYRAKLGPILVSREEAAGAFCALAPNRELPA